MKTNKLHDWLEIIGIFAVVASLIFVGLEMRQAHQISLSQAYQSRVASVVEWNTAFGANPAALSAQRKVAAGAIDEITPEERDAFRQTMLALFHLFDNAHLQYEKGFVSEGFWDMTHASMKLQMTNPITRTIFLDKVARGARPEFRKVVLGVGEELGEVRTTTQEADPGNGD